MNDSIVVYRSELERSRDMFLMEHPEIILWGFAIGITVILAVMIYSKIKLHRLRKKFPRW